MNYLYYLGNATLVLRVVEYLRSAQTLPVRFVTVIHQLNGWVVRVQGSPTWTTQQKGDFRAFLSELGIPYRADGRLKQVLYSLERGQSPVEVMRNYQIAVIAHGSPELTEIEAFRQQFIQGLGYCPETLA